ncbi:hypothetical protein QCM77_41355 [Bradyrhizobium sp. SSUT18]|uniref:hypothetical protein n=1 Tax=unclassified Bradyrhizobium TaxID=2631580 RepID=UPI00244D15BB|nr:MULTISPECIES: hypothetical protein [unclassified Bradyrhizobium]MDH2353931.1 hypothetical protein [Bradyrhizobium sp. SSUT112]MDH2406278.1 hypothetical protein [Bradyrhizobium sp. SSUT18]
MSAAVIGKVFTAREGSVSRAVARAYVYARFIRIGDGPDQVHLAAVGKELIKRGGVMG